MTKIMRNKVIKVGLETAYGTAVPIGDCTDIRAKTVRWNPQEGGDKDLAHEGPEMGNSATLPVDEHATLTFQTDLVGSGTAGIAPAFGRLLRCCGLAETIVADTSVTYNPISAGHESATMYLNVDGTLYLFIGTRGTAKIVLNASSEPFIEWSFTALYSAPIDAALPPVDLSAWLLPKVVSKANTPIFTIGGTTLYLRSLSLDLACRIEPRFLANKEEISLVNRAEVIQAQIEAMVLAAFNPFQLADTAAKPALTLQHEATAGRTITLTAPACQMMRPGAPTDVQGVKEIPLNMKPQRVSGNDQFTLAFT